MLIVKNIKKNNDGTYDTNWSLSDDQLSFLVTYAINSLLAQGLVDVEEKAPEDDSQIELKYLDALDSEQMHQS